MYILIYTLISVLKCFQNNKIKNGIYMKIYRQYSNNVKSLTTKFTEQNYSKATEVVYHVYMYIIINFA